MKALFIPLNTEPYEAFKAGSKTIEWRIYGKRWNESTCIPGRGCILSKGYGKKDRLTGVVLGITRHQIDDPTHIFNRFFAEKSKGQIAAAISIKVVHHGL